MAEIGIIGSGFSGLSAACYAAQQGHQVTVFEKNEALGGRARSFSAEGFLFDMGPSWYWMPDVFEKFFADFNKKPSDYYELTRLSPSFQIFFDKQPPLVVPDALEDLYVLFESIEKGAAVKLKQFLQDGEMKYKVAMTHLIYRPSLSLFEFASYDVITGALKSNIFQSMSRHIRSYFKDERLITLMEFPVIFLGAMPDKIPALYSLMNYAAFSMGTWYPMGGMHKIIAGMQQLATSLGVRFETGNPVTKIRTNDQMAVQLETKNGPVEIDAVIASADYQHVEQQLLDNNERNYTEKFWDKKQMAPSALLFYIGVNTRLKNLLHHNLFFDSDFNKHAAQIYTAPVWPDDPLFYVCCPSVTDSSVAPAGHENLFILIPLAAGLKDDKTRQEACFENVMTRLEKICECNIREHIVYKRSYSVDDFAADYNAYKGNAYGLANTLSQTAVLKPSIRNKNVKNIFYTGQLTVPGPGVPPAIISGKIAAEQLHKSIQKNLLNKS